MQFNIAKCHVMHIGKNNPKNVYLMGEVQLSETTEERDIGVTVSTSTTVSSQQWPRSCSPSPASSKAARRGQKRWLPPMVQAFTAIKTALMQLVCLAFPVDTAELSLATDASATHGGAVL